MCSEKFRLEDRKILSSFLHIMMQQYDFNIPKKKQIQSISL